MTKSTTSERIAVLRRVRVDVEDIMDGVNRASVIVRASVPCGVRATRLLYHRIIMQNRRCAATRGHPVLVRLFDWLRIEKRVLAKAGNGASLCVPAPLDVAKHAVGEGESYARCASQKNSKVRAAPLSATRQISRPGPNRQEVLIFRVRLERRKS